jgi:hypothetical protein
VIFRALALMEASAMTADLRFSVTHLLRAVLQPSDADRLLHALHVCSGCQSEEMVDELDLRGRSSPATHRICPFRIMWTAS